MFKQVTLYAVRRPSDGRNIVEGSNIIVETKDGKKISGILQDAGNVDITVYNPDDDTDWK